MLCVKSLGVTKGGGVFKIQPRSVCSRALFLFLCIFSGTEANPGHKRARRMCRVCFTCVTSFLSKCGYKEGERNEKSKRFCCSEISRVPKDGELDVFKITIKAATSA